MQVLKFVWVWIVSPILLMCGIVGIVSIFDDISQWGNIMSSIAPIVETTLFQVSSVILVVSLLIDTIIKHQDTITKFNPDITSCFRNRRVPHQATIQSSNKHIVRPDMLMSEAMEHVIFILFPAKRPNVGNLDVENPPASRQLTEKIRSGELECWGRYVGESTERKLTTGDWQYRELHHVAASQPYTTSAQTISVGSNDNHPLTGLRVNEEQLKSLFPENPLISLVEAAKLAYEYNLGSLMAGMAEASITGEKPDPIGWFATALVGSGDDKLQAYGIRPGLDFLVEVPKQEYGQYGIELSEEGACFRAYGRDVAYNNLHISKYDMEARIEEIKGWE